MTTLTRRTRLTSPVKTGHPEITTSSSRRRTGQIAGFLRLASRVPGYYPGTRDMAPRQSSHPGKLRFTSRNKGLSDDFRHVSNKGGRLDAVVAAGACQPYSLLAASVSFSLDGTEQLL